jgi:hypothetical protein
LSEGFASIASTKRRAKKKAASGQSTEMDGSIDPGGGTTSIDAIDAPLQTELSADGRYPATRDETLPVHKIHDAAVRSR